MVTNFYTIYRIWYGQWKDETTMTTTYTMNLINGKITSTFSFTTLVWILTFFLSSPQVYELTRQSHHSVFIHRTFWKWSVLENIRYVYRRRYISYNKYFHWMIVVVNIYINGRYEHLEKFIDTYKWMEC